MMTAAQSGSQNLYFHERLCRRQEFPKSSCCISSIAKTYIYHFIIGKKGKQTGDEPQAHQTSDIRRQTGSLRASFRPKRTQNICMLPLIQTYKYELTLMVGVLLWEHRGWMLHMALSYKAKNIGYNSMLSSVPTYSILLSTKRQV